MKVGIRFLILVLCVAGCDPADTPTKRSSDAGYADADLVGWWRFDEGGGSVGGDSSGFGNTATIRNGQWASGTRGGALEMRGTPEPDAIDDGIVIVPLSESLKSTAHEITVMSWTYRTAEHNVAVVAHQYPELFFGFHGPQFKWQIRGEPSTGFLATAARTLGVSSVNGVKLHGGRGASCYADLEYEAALDQWIHMAATYDGWRARLYVDGIEICSRRFWGSINMPDSPFTISGYLNESNEIIDEITGKLDDVRIYRRALSEAEIRAIYLQDSQ